MRKNKGEGGRGGAGDGGRRGRGAGDWTTLLLKPDTQRLFAISSQNVSNFNCSIAFIYSVRFIFFSPEYRRERRARESWKESLRKIKKRLPTGVPKEKGKKSIGPFESLLLLFSIQPGCDCGALVESSSFSGLVAVVRPAPAVRLPHSSSPHFEWRNKLINNHNITIKKEEEEKKTSEKKTDNQIIIAYISNED